MSSETRHGRLSTLQAAYVVARRDFVAILFSRSFLFFLLGPLFTMAIGTMAGGLGQRVQAEARHSELGIAMRGADVDRMLASGTALDPVLAGRMPDMVVVKRLAPGESFDPKAALQDKRLNVAAVLTGTPEAPVLTGQEARTEAWRGMVALVAAQAAGKGPSLLPDVAIITVGSSKVDDRQNRALTAQLGQVVLLLLTMLLAGMVLSNLVEEKGNKIIEVLAAAIPMDAVFFGKLFAMLAVSFVGICVWASAGGAIMALAGSAFTPPPAPAVGWPVFLLLGVVYFSIGYLLIGAVFLAIGSMAATVRDVQTLSLPATLLEVLVFFVASYAVTRPGSTLETVAMVFPFSSPYAMLAKAAQDGSLWPHGAAIAWQLVCVAILVRAGAAMFKKRVMKSGPAPVRKGGLFRRAAA
ncbi:MAG: ABC transporter permease [Novosphingobium sp.]